MKKRLVIVEASGKIAAMRSKLSSIGMRADVIATLGYIANNPRLLSPILLDENLREMAYQIRSERCELVAKIVREAVKADVVYLAMDDDQEGDVIAYDVANILAGQQQKLWRVRLRSMSGGELKAAFDGATQDNFMIRAHNGMCRRIVDRAIGAAYSVHDKAEPIRVGRVQNSLLATIANEGIQTGEFVIETRMPDGQLYRTRLPVSSRSDLDACSALAARVKEMPYSDFVATLNGDQEIIEEPCSSPWGYEEVIAQASLRLRIGIEQAVDVFQDAYEDGKVSYPRVRKNGVTPDAVEVALALARQNRCVFDAQLVPLRTGSVAGVAHEAPRPVEDDLQLGVSLNVLSASDALAVLVARNLIECGQKSMVRQRRATIEGREVLFSYTEKPPMRNWKTPVEPLGFSAYGREVAVLQLMAKHNLGRPSSIVQHVIKALHRGLIGGDDVSLQLSVTGKRWHAYGEQHGFHAKTSNQIDALLGGEIGDPNKAAIAILTRHNLIDGVLAVVLSEKSIQKTQNVMDYLI